MSTDEQKPVPNRRRKRDPRRDDMMRAMVACKAKLEEAEKMPDGPAKVAAQEAAIALLSKDAPQRPDRRKSQSATGVPKSDSELAQFARQFFSS